jgi:SET domain-containing protein
MKLNHAKHLPHQGVYTRLAPSPLHGVGVFAIRPIKKATQLFGDDDTGLIAVSPSSITRLPHGLKRLYRDFCIIQAKGKSYLCPKNFNLMTVSWYLNHSAQPNVRCDRNFNFYSLRHIKIGEELTVDYDSYNEFPDGKHKFKGD